MSKDGVAILSQTEGLSLFVLFSFVMIGLVFLKTKQEKHADGFLVADRQVSAWRGAFSIAVSWIWAPAIFICSLQAYTKGLPGVFWFIFPNIICFFTFAVAAVRLRNLLPDGYTLPEFIWYRFGQNKLTHISFLIIAFGYQLAAIIINAVAGGTLLHLVSGIPVSYAIIGMVSVALSYALFSGLKASIITDIVQMSMILVIGGFLVPWTIIEAGGFSSITNGLSGITGEYGFLFDPKIAWLMGVPMTIALISGPLSDQMFYQRAMAVKKEDIVKVFVRGGILFGMVPIVLSLLGFIGVTLVKETGLQIDDPQMIGAYVIAELLPKWALYLFCLMAFSGLASTLDSALCAISSLGSIDIYRRYINKKPSDKELLRVSRIFMITIAGLGTGIALLEPKLLWVFFISGLLVSSGLFPTIFALFWSRISGAGIFTAIIATILIVTPVNIYANISGDENLIVMASLASLGIGLAICMLSGFIFPAKDFSFSKIKNHKTILNGES